MINKQNKNQTTGELSQVSSCLAYIYQEKELWTKKQELALNWSQVDVPELL